MIKPSIKEIKKSSNLFKKIRDAFNTSKMVLSWGGKVFGEKPNAYSLGSNLKLVDQIWEPFLTTKTIPEFRERLSQWKTVRTWLMKLLGSSSDERKVLLSCPPKGSFKWVNALIGKWLSDMPAWERRAWMTAFFSTRALITEGDPDYSQITQDSKKLTPSYTSKVKGFWRKLRINNTRKTSRRVQWRDWHLTSKQGPNGPALSTLLRDYASLSEEDKQNLLVLGGKRFGKAIKTMDIITPWFTNSKLSVSPGDLRKISYFGDIEGKTRVIAVLDYFSQSVLKPLHSFLFQILKRIPQDFTFNQGGFRKHSEGWTDLYSCDLTAATDRFPIKIISEVLAGILPDDYVKSWEYIMIKLPFKIPGGNSVSYARGNPMGAYSSWASFAVAHHFVMYLCCENLGIKWHTAKYALLGDDILIGDTQLYREYRKILLDLDVPVSEQKTHESKTLCEFAKRWIYQGQEITPFPIPAMMECKNYAFLSALLCQEYERGYETDIPSSVRLWFELKDKNRNHRSGVEVYKRRNHYHNLEVLALTSEAFIKTFRKELTWEEAFTRIYTAAANPNGLEPYMSSEWIASFWGIFLRDLWLKSSDSHMIGQVKYHESPNQGDPHIIWQNLMMENFFELDERTEDGSLDVKLVPWVSLAGQLTMTSDDSYFTVVQLLKGKLSNLEGWEAVRRLVLPDLGTVFRERKYNIIRVLAGRLSSDLVKVIQGKRRLVHLSNYNKGILSYDEPPEVWEGTEQYQARTFVKGRVLINPMSPEILLDIGRERS